MADINIDGVVTWLKNWFYDKTEITGFLNNKANQSDLQTTNGNLANLSSTVDNKVDKVTGKGLSTEDFTTALKDKLDGIEAQANKTTVDSALSSTSTNPLQNKAINSALSGKASTSHAHYIGNSSSDNGSLYIYPNGDGQNPAHLGAWLKALENQISSIANVDLIEVVSVQQWVQSLENNPSADTMNKFFVVADTDQTDIYYTVRSGTSPNYTYSWNNLDTDILDDLSIDWDDINDKPSTFTPSSHTHGQITNDGKITSTAVTHSVGDMIVITDASDSNKIKRTTYLPTLFIKDPNSHSNIGTDAQADQQAINNRIDISLGNKGDKTDDIDWSYNSDGFTNGVKLVDKTTNANGRITLHLKS